MNIFKSFDRPIKVAVIGASGGIGSAFCDQLSTDENIEKIYRFSRSQPADIFLDFMDEKSIQSATKNIDQLDVILVATGLLHHDDIKPEKSLRDMSFEKFQEIIAINTIGPALIAKYFIPLLPKKERSIFAAISARVGSISDNHLGGWYAYRASKAALNMTLKNIAIEIARTHKHAVIAGLHPGTVDTDLSKPFQSFVKAEKLFTPSFSTQKMLEVLNNLTPEQSGRIFAYDGSEIEP